MKPSIGRLIVLVSVVKVISDQVNHNHDEILESTELFL